MPNPSLWLALLFAAPIACILRADESPALAVYKSANYEAALPLLQSAAAKNPSDPLIQAALLTTLVNCDRVEDALAANKQDETAFPNSPDVLAARGEFAFYMGDMGAAERLWKSAGKLNDNTARAYFGLAKLYRAASFYRTARLFCLKAHDLDPDDAGITRLWLGYVPAEKRRELLGPFMDAHPWLYKFRKQGQETEGAISDAVGEDKIYATEGGPREVTMKFFLLMKTAQHARGVGLDFRIGNGKPLRMLFDTGASGITVKQSAVDKAGLEHLGSGVSWGAGDKGTRNLFGAVSDTCEVGTLKFKTCVFGAFEGKNVAGDEDGLIGADFFHDYIVQIDFQNHTLHLTPLPQRPSNPQGYDRVIAPEESQFTPVFRFGHMLFVTTKVNDRASGLFLLDTGAELSNIDSTFARMTTKLHGNDYLRVKGISGSVKDVYDADKANLQFGRFKQENQGLPAFNLNNAPEHRDVRMSGILGINVLSMFRLTIDYRNGLVNFDYILDNKKK